MKHIKKLVRTKKKQVQDTENSNNIEIKIEEVTNRAACNPELVG